MATTTQGGGSRVSDELEGQVPIREGEYGDRVVAVEPGGNEYIPLRERHGRPLDLFWTWMSPNMEFATVFVGVLAVGILGMGFANAALAIIIGTALGSLTHGILSSWGPRYGVPQMVQARGAFGFLGNILPAGLNAVTASIGWFIVNSVSGSFALAALTGLDFRITFVVIVIAQVGVAFVGHNMVHRFEKVVFPFLTLVFGAALIVILVKAHLGAGPNAKAEGPLGESGAFIIAATAAFGYAVGWNPYASDYTRYLPHTVNRRSVGLAAGLGVFVSCALLEIAGAAVATLGGTNPNPVSNFIAPLPDLLGKLVLLGIAVGAVSANVINIYSGAMSFLTLGIRMSLHQRRALVALTSGVIALAIGIYFEAQVGPGTKYEDFLLLISYWIAPFLAVVITDSWLRRGEYDERTFFDSGYRPWKGLVAMVAGLLVSVLFWNQALFVGPIPKAYPQLGDLTFVVGFIVAGVVHYGLNMRLRTRVTARRAELA